MTLFFRIVLSLGVLIGSSEAAWAAQAASPAAPAVDLVDADPIKCWWRTSVSAVRVGEPFTVVLTCAVVENEMTKVVPDQSRLEPAAMQFPPFEIVGGSRSADIHSSQRRFFQYQYTLRLINTDSFGSDVSLPSAQVTYQIETKVEQGAAIRGREQTYALPAESIRVMSLVQGDASDIRDVPAWTFGDIDAQRFRARIMTIVAGILLGLASLILVVALVGLFRRYRRPEAIGARLVSDGAILQGVGRELSAVRRGAAREGWTHELAGRALAAFRVAGSVAVGQSVGQRLAGKSNQGLDGHLSMRSGVLRGKKLLVSGSATTEAVGQELARAAAESASGARQQCLENLQRGLALLTAVQFGRDQSLDGPALDDAVAGGGSALRHLKYENFWPVKKLRAMTQFGVELGSRVWSR